ncbi:DUF1801 domain-containing protein [Agromyces sp. SYSU K20354]|uniref:iron chaperone n=1 Tax=Agromyces cavernae TaxID=2898659 RepID=UPI001E369087|nr:DUF1801 domain-containing protein [Agromyces cavernae]MCD2443302.1 DUF1801 domain-containing protein [Agromyces cavernae]
MGIVTDYLAAREGENRTALEHVITVARELAPDATEGESYGMPALLYRGKGLVAVLEAKAHLGLYPFSGQVLPGLAADLDDFDWSPGALQFTAEHPVPDDLLRRIITDRMSQIDAQLDKKRRPPAGAST